jgi:hypothetical protein
VTDPGHDRFDDERLARLLGASAASSDPATLTRAMARVRVAGHEPAWLGWLERPAALVAAASLLVVSLGAGVWYGRGAALSETTVTSGTATTDSDLLGSLLAGEAGADATGGGVIDSGGVR